jgi:cell wall-associated NlpC family hydrolase
VACYAEKEWTTWQSGGISHDTLLNSYTNGSPDEEWCADFVSYVYKEAGYPFTQGSSNGWDENNANYIQYMGFAMHSASSGYVPKPGDIAFFNYNAGHVEIVVSGGSHPTFIYGDSATIDPTTGNGQMKANTILSDSDGQIVYYLSPN